MKRAVALLLPLAVASPSVALAQLPVAAPSDAKQSATPPPPSAASPSASGPVSGAPPATTPGDQYYVEPAPPAPAAEPADDDDTSATPPAVFEPPPPPELGFEPPPPPAVHHVAPQTALWLGARVGWFVPFGNVWARARPLTSASGTAYSLEGVPWRDYASSGPMLELDAGLRLSRAYTLFGLWERAQLGSGDSTSDGEPDGAESDFWAVGLRAVSNPDRLAFVTEVAVGYRRARSFYTNGFEVQFTDAPFEARLGLGAELRLSRLGSLSALVTVGVGGFGTIEKVSPNGDALPQTSPRDQGDGHGWVTLSVGGHFDLLASKY